MGCIQELMLNIKLVYVFLTLSTCPSTGPYTVLLIKYASDALKQLQPSKFSYISYLIQIPRDLV